MAESLSELPPRAAQANSRRKQQVNRLGKTVVEQMKIVSDEQAQRETVVQRRPRSRPEPRKFRY